MTSAEETPVDEDRLPWLETADEDYQERPSLARILPLILLGLGVVAAVVFGVMALRGPGSTGGNGQMIAAQEGDYKLKPDETGGRTIDGEGAAATATSEGKAPKGGAVDAKQMPEAPVALPGGKGAQTAAHGAPGAVVQLGSFPDQAGAEHTWAIMSKRLAYLAPLGHSVEKAEVSGQAVYRLRVNAGSANAASELCAKVKVAGEACFVPAK